MNSRKKLENGETALLIFLIILFLTVVTVGIWEDRQLDRRCRQNRSWCVAEEHCQGVYSGMTCWTEWSTKTPTANEIDDP
jgi:hypothetical protein